MAPRLSDIAAALGLNLGTVSRALRDDPRIKAATRQKVKEAADQLGYRPHWGARALAEGRSRTVWLLVEGLESPVERDPARWAGLRLLSQGYDLLLAQHYGNPEVYTRLLDRLANGGADGALVVSRWSVPDDEPDRRLALSGFPFVYVDRAVASVSVPVVTTDNFEAAAALVGLLAAKARLAGRPLGWIGNGFQRGLNAVETERHLGVVEASRREGLPIADAPGSEPGAWVASSPGDLRLGARPGDWAGVFDHWPGDYWPLAGVVVARQDFRAMGEKAADILLARLEGRQVPEITRIPGLPFSAPENHSR